jgi:UDP-N-acetylmuramate-alanine ligase
VGREDKKIKKRINAKILVEKIDRPDVIYLGKEKIVEYLKKNLRGREVVIIMGAGDVYKLYQQF